jgi:naphthoate synthase
MTTAELGLPASKASGDCEEIAAEDGLAGIRQLARDATILYHMDKEAQAGRDAFVEQRPPDFRRLPRRP